MNRLRYAFSDFDDHLAEKKTTVNSRFNGFLGTNHFHLLYANFCYYPEMEEARVFSRRSTPAPSASYCLRSITPPAFNKLFRIKLGAS